MFRLYLSFTKIVTSLRRSEVCTDIAKPQVGVVFLQP
jgi:hypothetical protein